MSKTWLFLAAGVLMAQSSRPPDIPFQVHTIDPGASETAAVMDVNKDGRLDILSGENWYEAPSWTRHPFRKINFTNNYIDNFCDLPIDVDGDGYLDVVSVSWFARNIVWWKNPGKGGGPWVEQTIDSGSPVEFAFLVDLDNDGQARELLPEFGNTRTPAAWYEVKAGKWVKHEVSDQSYGHGIGAGDVNGDGRADILTPRGWLEAPADLRAGNWQFHPDWEPGMLQSERSGRGGARGAARGGGPGRGQAGAAGAARGQGAAQEEAVPPRVEYSYMYVIDINGDGRNDVLTTNAHDYGILWLEHGEDGKWTRHNIDASWSQAHATALVDLNGDGQLDLVTGKRYMAHNGNDPGEREPLGVYWYEYRKTPAGAVEWIRHIIDFSTRMGGGMEIRVADLDGDGDLDVVSGGKSGLFLAENLTKSPAAGGRR